MMLALHIQAHCGVTNNDHINTVFEKKLQWNLFNKHGHVFWLGKLLYLRPHIVVTPNYLSVIQGYSSALQCCSSALAHSAFSTPLKPVTLTVEELTVGVIGFLWKPANPSFNWWSYQLWCDQFPKPCWRNRRTTHSQSARWVLPASKHGSSFVVEGNYANSLWPHVTRNQVWLALISTILSLQEGWLFPAGHDHQYVEALEKHFQGLWV